MGANISVPTIDGENKEIEIPPGTQTGDLIKIKGQGSPVLGRSNVRGDHLVNIIVKIPRKLSRAQQRLFEELSKEMIDDKAEPYAREESWFKKMMNNMYSSYDYLLNKKYKVEINQKTLERVKNYYR